MRNRSEESRSLNPISFPRAAIATIRNAWCRGALPLCRNANITPLGGELVVERAYLPPEASRSREERSVTTVLGYFCAACVAAAVCGGLWVDWKLNWGRKRETRGFDVIPRGRPVGEKGE